LPDPDACADFLPQATIPPSAEEDRKQERELEGAEEAISSKDDELQLRHAEDQDPGQIPATTASLSAIMGEPILGNRLPAGTAFKPDGYRIRKRWEKRKSRGL
jgi:hypothetical protein